jgi:hypothetical protein
MIFTHALEDTTMLQNPRLKHLLAAGMLTGLVLATLIAFAWRGTSRTATDAAHRGDHDSRRQRGRTRRTSARTQGALARAAAGGSQPFLELEAGKELEE